MKLEQIYTRLDEISPFATQENWDNSGLIIGSLDDNVEQIYLSLDVDFDLIENAKPNSLLITHHPLIFKGLKSLNFNIYPSNLINKMIAKNLSLILGFTPNERDGFVLYADVNLSFNELCEIVKMKLNLSHLRICKGRKFNHNAPIKRLAFCTGSGGDLISSVKADVFLTGDLKYHQALEASHNNLNLIDIGHYESEAFFGASLEKYLQNLGVCIIIYNSKNPFTNI